MSGPVPLQATSWERGAIALPASEERLGPYVLLRELGSGGMATVYLARSDEPCAGSRALALKVMHRHLARCDEFVAMFADEARLCARIRHRNVCQAFGFAPAWDTHCLSMEYLLGEPLSAVFQRTCERARDARHVAPVVRVIADACLGLQAAHTLCDEQGRRLNVVHRDVSPDNLFVTYAGVSKILDFGLASARAQLHESRSGIIKGKFAYVCPEALRGGKVGRKADLFGLGVVLWELLTGRRLFRAESDVETLAAVQEATIVPPSSVRPELPPELDGPVLRALSRKPSARHASALALRRDLFSVCPRAAELSERDVAEWLASLFPEQRRAKARELAELERSASGARVTRRATERDELGAGVSDRSRSRAKLCRERTHILFAAAMLALLLLAGAISRSGPKPRRALEKPAPRAQHEAAKAGAPAVEQRARAQRRRAVLVSAP